jgi:hypothetical protein
MERLEAHRFFFANLITASAGVAKNGARLTAAFASTPRELGLRLCVIGHTRSSR